jgi:hypothetical protein
LNAPARLAAFGLGLVAVFGAALGVGRLTGPVAAGHSAAGGGAGAGSSGSAAGTTTVTGTEGEPR